MQMSTEGMWCTAQYENNSGKGGWGVKGWHRGEHGCKRDEVVSELRHA